MGGNEARAQSCGSPSSSVPGAGRYLKAFDRCFGMGFPLSSQICRGAALASVTISDDSYRHRMIAFDMTKRFVFDLDDDRRAKLEAYRARMGLRSLAAALHSLIDHSETVVREHAGQPATGVVPHAPPIGVRSEEPKL